MVLEIWQPSVEMLKSVLQASFNQAESNGGAGRGSAIQQYNDVIHWHMHLSMVFCTSR